MGISNLKSPTPSSTYQPAPSLSFLPHPSLSLSSQPFDIKYQYQNQNRPQPDRRGKCSTLTVPVWLTDAVRQGLLWLLDLTLQHSTSTERRCAPVKLARTRCDPSMGSVCVWTLLGKALPDRCDWICLLGSVDKRWPKRWAAVQGMSLVRKMDTSSPTRLV